MVIYHGHPPAHISAILSLASSHYAREMIAEICSLGGALATMPIIAPGLGVLQPSQRKSIPEPV